MKIDDKDLEIEYICAKTRGGQHANKTASNVRITHIPTGISVTINGRSQQKNNALVEKITPLGYICLSSAAASKRHPNLHEPIPWHRTHCWCNEILCLYGYQIHRHDEYPSGRGNRGIPRSETLLPTERWYSTRN